MKWQRFNSDTFVPDYSGYPFEAHQSYLLLMKDGDIEHARAYQRSAHHITCFVGERNGHLLRYEDVEFIAEINKPNWDAELRDADPECGHVVEQIGDKLICNSCKGWAYADS